MESLIKETFKFILKTEVRVVLQPEDEVEYGIYPSHYSTKEYSDEKLAEYTPDYMLFSHENEWYFGIYVETAGTYWQPPDGDILESKESYEKPENALKALIDTLIEDRWQDILMCREERG